MHNTYKNHVKSATTTRNVIEFSIGIYVDSR
jgi:hypothetical protein